MYNVRKYLLVALVITGLFAGLYISGTVPEVCLLKLHPAGSVYSNDAAINLALGLLKIRHDDDALMIFKRVLTDKPEHPDAVWGVAEVLRRRRDYLQAGDLLNRILSRNPQHVPSLISLSYIKYNEDKLDDAQQLINQALKISQDRENRALAYMMLASINSRRSQKGWLLSKIAYGIRIKDYFMKARELAPDFPEAHLGLGTFYLLAPGIIGGDLDKALEELEQAVKIAPDFATANARLAQAFRMKGDLEKYNLHIKRAKELDPENEVLSEIGVE